MKNIIFGASNFGKIIYEEIKEKCPVDGFFDNDKRKWNTEFQGLKVLKPEFIEDVNVIVASTYRDEIVIQLIEMGYRKFSVSYIEKQNNLIEEYDYTCRKINKVKNKILLLDDSGFSGSNTLVLYKYLKEKGKYDVSFIGKENKDYFLELVESDMIIRTHDGSYIHGKKNIQLWHGIPLKGIHYATKYLKEDYENKHLQWTKFKISSYSTMFNTLMGACFGVNFTQFDITGAPRNDALIHSNGRENLEMIKPEVKNKKVIFYMPTFRQTIFGQVNGKQDGYLFNYENIEELNKYLGDNNIVLVSKMHPYEEADYERFFEDNAFDNMILLKESELGRYNLDLYEVLNGSDILITDYSSVNFDYLLLNKPMIFLNRDLEDYMETRGLLLEPYDYWTAGEKCKSVDELIKEIQKLSENKDMNIEKRKIIKNIMHKYDDGEFCRRNEELIDKMLKC